MKNEFIQKISNDDFNKYSKNKKCFCCKCITSFCYCSCQCKCHNENMKINNTNIINYDQLPNLNIDELRMKSLKEYTSNNILNKTPKTLNSSRSMNYMNNFNFNNNGMNTFYSLKRNKDNLTALDNLYINKSQEGHYIDNNKKFGTTKNSKNLNINMRNKYDTMSSHYKTQTNFNLKKYYQLNNDDKKNSEIDNNSINSQSEFNKLFSSIKNDDAINKRKNFKIPNKIYNTFVKREDNFRQNINYFEVDFSNIINNTDNLNNLERKTIDINNYRLDKYKDNFENNFTNDGFKTEYNKAFKNLNFKNQSINLKENNIIFRNDNKSLTIDKYDNTISSNFSRELSAFNNNQNGGDKQFINDGEIIFKNDKDNNSNNERKECNNRYINKLNNKYLLNLEFNSDNLNIEKNINKTEPQEVNNNKNIESQIKKNNFKTNVSTQIENKNNKNEILESKEANIDNFILTFGTKGSNEIKSKNNQKNAKVNSDENINSIINDYENLKKKYAPNRLFTGLQNNINNLNNKIKIHKDNSSKNSSNFSISSFNINLKGELNKNSNEINDLKIELDEAKNKIEELTKLVNDYKKEINSLKGQNSKSKIESISNSKIYTINNISTSNNNSNKTRIGKDSFIIKIPESLIKRKMNKGKINKNESSNEITNSNMNYKENNEINTLLDLTNNTYRKIHLRNNSNNFNNISNISNNTNSNCLTNNNISNITNNEIYTKKITTTMKKKFRKSASQKFRINNIRKKLYVKPVESKRTSKLIYTIITQNDDIELLSFDVINHQFNIINFVDFDNFEADFKESYHNNEEDNFSIYLNSDKGDNFYIVTGKNCDKLYKYNIETNSMKKLYTFKNNHSNGCLLYINDKIICLSGNYNKKVEMFSEKNNSLINLPEMNIERSNFSCCFVKNEYIFALFGYNFPTEQYLNTIEIYNLNEFQNNKTNYIHINDDEWRFLSYKDNNSLNLYIKGHCCFNYFDEKIIFFGGFNGYLNKVVDCFYQLNLSENFNTDENNEDIYIEPLGKKLCDIHKNRIYYFGNNSGTTFEFNRNNIFFSALDSNYYAHTFNINNFKHNIHYLN